MARGIESEQKDTYYTGQCNSKGNGGYGTYIYYTDGKSYKSEYLSSITGEMYSDHSFCFLSSLFKIGTKNINYFSQINRAICYNIYCSERSLTVQIHDDYIVCPRAGGKIIVEGYEGFFLCPDYNLMCSGTVICNDMFDCVDKKSEVKNSSYIYDYEIKTSQNIENAYIINDDNISNYELSQNATCPIYCKHCKENQKCIKCKNDYVLVGNYNEEKVECFEENFVINGYYQSENNTYYKCMENCENCLDGQSCEKCMDGYHYSNNKCIENCKEYDQYGICSKCAENFGFNKTDKTECINIDLFQNYFTTDGGISYYPCNENISDCQNCFYNEIKLTLDCFLCEEQYILVNEKKCYLKEYIENNKAYIYLNETHAKKCSEEIENCDECENNEICTKCNYNFFLLNNIKNKCFKKDEIEFIDEYYLSEDNTTYYSCNNTNYNSIKNCKKCLSNNTCYFCQDDYTFINGNKSFCYNKNELNNKYILDPNDNSNYIKCSEFITNCDTCNNEKCILCNNGYIFINDNFSECIFKDSIEIDFYFTNDNITYYSCKDDKYKDNEKCQEILRTTIPEKPTTFPQISTDHIIQSTFDEQQEIISSTIPKNGIKIIQTSIIEKTIQNIDLTTIPHITSTQFNQPPIQSTEIVINNQTYNNPITSKLTTIINEPKEQAPSTIIEDIISTTVPKTQNNSIPILPSSEIPKKINNTSSIYNDIPSTINSISIPTSLPKQSSIITPLSYITNRIDTTIITQSTNSSSSSSIPTIINNIQTTVPSNPIKPKTSFKDISTNIIKETIPKIFPSTIVNNYTLPIKEKALFFLQAQIVNERLMLFITTNFPVLKNKKFVFNADVYSTRYLRNLEKNNLNKVELSFHSKEDYDGNGKQIIPLISDEEIKEKKVVVENLKNENDIEIILLDNNKDILDTQKVKEKIQKGGIDYYEITENKKEYNVYQYKIISSTRGCDFDLISENKIGKGINKNIVLNFVDIKTNEKISAKCLLSEKNENEIICTLDNNIDNNYILEPYILSGEKETITIIQKNTKDYLSLICDLDELDEPINFRNSINGGKSGLSTCGIISIILSIIFMVTISSDNYIFL